MTPEIILSLQKAKEDLVLEIANSVFKKIKEQNLFNDQPQEKDVFLSREEAAELIGISLPLLDNLTKSKKLRSNRLKSRVLYSRKDLIEDVKKTGKFNRAN